MVKIRLARRGNKKRPYYHIVAADARAPRDGKFIEKLGFYNPMDKNNYVGMELERIDYWLSVGAQPTERVGKLIEIAKKNSTEEVATS